MSYNLFLDDERHPSDVTWENIGLGPWVIVRNFDQFAKAIIDRGVPDKVTFDHDLGPEHYEACFSGSHDYGTVPTGYDCCKWFVNWCAERGIPFPPYRVHSMNPVGSENIHRYIASAKKSGYIT